MPPASSSHNVHEAVQEDDVDVGEAGGQFLIERDSKVGDTSHGAQTLVIFPTQQTQSATEQVEAGQVLVPGKKEDKA